MTQIFGIACQTTAAPWFAAIIEHERTHAAIPLIFVMRNTRDRPTSDPLEGVRTARKVVPRSHHYGKLRREYGSPSKIQHCNRSLLAVSRRMHSGAQFTAPIRILYRAKRQSTHLILDTKNMVSVSLKILCQMPSNVEMMVSRTLDHIANQVSPIL